MTDAARADDQPTRGVRRRDGARRAPLPRQGLAARARPRPLGLSPLRRDGRRRADPDPDPCGRRRPAVAGAGSADGRRGGVRRGDRRHRPPPACGDPRAATPPQARRRNLRPATAWRCRPTRSNTSVGCAELGVPERAIEIERDAWILVAAQLPAQMPVLMALQARCRSKTHGHCDVSRPRRSGRLGGGRSAPAGSRRPTRRRCSRRTPNAGARTRSQTSIFDAELVELLDEVFVSAVPVARTLLHLLGEAVDRMDQVGTSPPPPA